jgi:choline dehydrogenase
LEGVRVIDASSLRYIPNGNIYAPTMMTAEKAADLIRGLEPLEPITEPFYRHQPAAVSP